jgi:hypothetical protein
MIRIDEIYYNVFVSAMQDKMATVHWFEPFGTSEFENICSCPLINEPATRILCWDQEPVRLDRAMPVVKQFQQKFQDPIVLVTSEFNSSNVLEICDTYSIKSSYYFFHGWAALDWYRGYNKTFLIQPWHQRKIYKTFLAPNRIIAGERQHRLEMLYHIFKRNLVNNHVSCPDVCPAENVTIQHAVQPLVKKYSDIESVFAAQNLPLNFEGEIKHPMHSCWLSLFKESAESLLYLVTETVATGQRLHLTEKTFKPIALGMPFVIVGTQGSLEYLRSYGFRTFEGIWDESYDLASDDVRIEQIASLLQSLDDLPARAKQDLFESTHDVIKHNWNHFYGGGFEAVLWQELTGMIQQW